MSFIIGQCGYKLKCSATGVHTFKTCPIIFKIYAINKNFALNLVYNFPCL